MIRRVYLGLPLAFLGLAGCEGIPFLAPGAGAGASKPATVTSVESAPATTTTPLPAPTVEVAPIEAAVPTPPPAPTASPAPVTRPLVIEDLTVEEVSAPVIVTPSAGGGFDSVKAAIAGIGCVVDGPGTEFIIMDQLGVDEVELASQVAALKESGDIVSQGSGYRLTTGACAS